jgi:hypothetical protein
MVRVTEHTIRLTLDIAMTVLLLCSFAYRITGDTAHEWIGVVILLLFILHIIINRKWFTLIFNGAYSSRRVIMTVVNLLLAVDFAILLITGLSHSRTVLSFLHLSGSITLRQIHTTAAYWGLILIAVHIGIHWRIIINFVKGIAENKKGFPCKIIMRVLAIAFVIFGVWSSFDRDIFSKLFLGFSFDYWSPESPIVLFFAETISIMGIYIFTSYHFMKLLDWLKKSNRFQSESEQ